MSIQTVVKNQVSSLHPQQYVKSIPPPTNILHINSRGIIHGSYIATIIPNQTQSNGTIMNTTATSSSINAIPADNGIPSTTLALNSEIPKNSNETTAAALSSAQNSTQVAIAEVKKQGIFQVTHTYEGILNGTAFVIKVKNNINGHSPKPADISTGLASLKKINGLQLEPDRDVVATDINTQVVPTGVERVGGDHTFANVRNGTVTATVAIIDTGIDVSHPNLDVIGGKSFITNHPSYDDNQGHGTHVAGIVAAKNMSKGVVGVAPGARLYALKVLDDSGHGNLSDILSAIEWVTANASKIDAVNLSLKFPGSSDNLNKAISESVQSGVTYVVAAGNDADNASNYSPARLGGTGGSVITVGAIADSDGKCGARGHPLWAGNDDQLPTIFDNYGHAVDILARGTDIYSTYMHHGYSILTGTSMAAPHVTGAVALYKTLHPQATPSQVKAALLQLAIPFSRSTACNGHGQGYIDLSPDPETKDRTPLLYVGDMR
jgi:subtilisin family serine protease